MPSLLLGPNLISEGLHQQGPVLVEVEERDPMTAPHYAELEGPAWVLPWLLVSTCLCPAEPMSLGFVLSLHHLQGNIFTGTQGQLCNRQEIGKDLQMGRAGLCSVTGPLPCP